ncbi:MAG: type II secretion system protein M [Pseudomonadota bacterium]
MESLKAWWQNLQTREQQLVMYGGIAVIILMFYTLAWSPLVNARDIKSMQVENNQELLSWMKTKSAEVKQLRLSNPQALRSDSNRSLLAIVDSLANQLGLRSAIRQIEPNGQDSVSIWMDEIEFDALITMIGQLEKRSNIVVSEASVNKLDQPGFVQARIQFYRK